MEKKELLRISKADYLKIHSDFRGVFESEREDWPNWQEVRHQYIGKRTMMKDGALLIEGLSFIIVDEQPASSPKTASQEKVKDQVLKYLEGLSGETSLAALRSALGHTEVGDDPQANPVHQAVKALRDAGRIHVVEPRWGEPRVSVISWPSSQEEWSNFPYPSFLTGAEVSYLMTARKVTIDQLAARMQITKKRIRQVRDDKGLTDRHAVRDWAEAICKPKIENVFTLEDHTEFRKRAKAGDILAAEWKAEFERMLASRTEFVAALESKYNATQMKNLAGNLGNFSASSNTKYENARAVYRSMLQMFLIEDSFSYNPMAETHEQAVARQVRAIDQEKLTAYFEKRGAVREETKRACEAPETLADFQTFIRYRGKEELSDQQLARFDSLQADISRDKRAKEKTPETIRQIESDIEDLELTIIEGFHTKHQCKLWIVQLSDRVDRSVYNELNRKAKALGGRYSSFVKAEAGFQFRDQDSANKFIALLHGDINRKEQLEARKEWKEQTAAERLTRLAADLHAEAEATIVGSKEALQNTVRRAEMQAGIRGRAYADQALAQTITRVAAALETGSAKYLDGVRHKTHVELLEYLLRRAKTNRLQQLQQQRNKTDSQPSFDEREAERERPVSLEDIRYAKYPYPVIYKRHLEEAVAKCSRAKGAKLASTRMAKRLKHVKDDFVRFDTDYDVSELRDFLSRVKSSGHDTAWMDREVEDYKRLRAANIHTLEELRCALRELLPLMTRPAGDSPVEIAQKELIGRQLPGFFPTPARIVNRMLEAAELESQHRILEPSCGKGDIADGILARNAEANITMVEMNRTLADVLTAKGYDPVFGDFLQFGTGENYDRILMNPPFENLADIDHVQHAYQLLAPGGRIVAIMGEGAFFRQDGKAEQFRAWLDEVGGSSEQLPDDAFKGADAFRQTAVRTRLVIIER